MRNTILYRLTKEIEDAKAEAKSHYRLAQEEFLKDLVGEEWDQVFEWEQEDVFKIIGYEKLWAKIQSEAFKGYVVVNNEPFFFLNKLYLFHWNGPNFKNELCYFDCRSNLIKDKLDFIVAIKEYENWLDLPFWKKPFVEKFR